MQIQDPTGSENNFSKELVILRDLNAFSQLLPVQQGSLILNPFLLCQMLILLDAALIDARESDVDACESDVDALMGSPMRGPNH
jgi:hypothetical protein